MFQRLQPDERLNLVRFVCSFAWADLNVSVEEKDYVRRLVKRLHLPGNERERVEEWLRRPPAPDSVDPNRIPPEHKEIFLDTIRGLVASDLEVSREEREAVSLLERLLAGQ